ncbi:MAG: cysteine hydrolase [Nitratireductor sp.]|nr:cysteine hydrolase [Nitratireductor sp.]
MTSGPKTLLQLAGAPLAPASLAEASVVVIDAQCEYRDGALPLTNVDPALVVIAGLLDRARRAGAPVIHVAHKGRAGGLFDREGQGGDFLDAARPAPGETIVEKALPNAFVGTDLHRVLEATGRSKLILVGFQTHMCVSATARAALDLGYLPTIAADGCATRELPDPLTGETIPAATLHMAELAALADRFAIVVNAEAIPG